MKSAGPGWGEACAESQKHVRCWTRCLRQAVDPSFTSFAEDGASYIFLFVFFFQDCIAGNPFRNYQESLGKERDPLEVTAGYYCK